MVALRSVSLGPVGNYPASFGVLLTMTSLGEFLVVLEEHFPDPTVRGKKFEPFLRDALLVSPSHQFVNVWCWEDWPGRDGPDRGIDNIGELLEVLHD